MMLRDMSSNINLETDGRSEDCEEETGIAKNVIFTMYETKKNV